MKLIIKNMVCPRCVQAVENILKQNDLKANYIHLGEVELQQELNSYQIDKLSLELKNLGFELLDDQKKQLIEKIKTLLIEEISKENIKDHFSISKFLSKRLLKDYSTISKLFSEVEGMTLEQYFILQKIEKVKELLTYNQLSLSEIAINLGYSSTQHLSNQFKKVTGMTPTKFKEIGAAHRRSLDTIGK